MEWLKDRERDVHSRSFIYKLLILTTVGSELLFPIGIIQFGNGAKKNRDKNWLDNMKKKLRERRNKVKKNV